jgi:hypothetical protein
MLYDIAEIMITTTALINKEIADLNDAADNFFTDDDSIYNSPTFGKAETCPECGAPMIGITTRMCANTNCEV